MARCPLYIAAYDITDAKRLRQMHTLVQDYASGGQKSAYECYLTAPARQALIEKGGRIIRPDEDQFLLIHVRPAATLILGCALPPATEFGYLG